MCKVHFGTNCVSILFFKILYYILYSSYDIFIRKCFRSNRESKALPEEIGFYMGQSPGRHINNPCPFICYVNGTLRYFILANQFIKFPYVSFLLNQKISYTNFDESFLQDGTPQVL